MAAASVEESRIEAVRRFTRFYTRRLGVLGEGLLASSFTLAEARILYELAHREGASAAEIGRDLALDPGYLSRILKRFEETGLVRRARAAGDARRRTLALTAAGRAAFAPLDRRSAEQVGALLRELPEGGRSRLVAALAAVESLLAEPGMTPPVTLRPHRPGDMGWVVQRHGILYAEEYGFDETFEALVAEIVAAFVRGFDPARERCWIAERAGAPVGSIFLVRQSDEVAKLRLLLVEPEARGSRLGRRLTEECIRFAKGAGYRRLTLWTNDVLHAARRIYENTGFELVASEPHRSFGRDLVGETWELDLERSPPTVARLPLPLRERVAPASAEVGEGVLGVGRKCRHPRTKPKAEIRGPQGRGAGQSPRGPRVGCAARG